MLCLKSYLNQKSTNQFLFQKRFPFLNKFLMEKPIDLPKLKSMIKDGIACIPKDPNADQAVIVIGDTGVGKSTILAFLSGEKLMVKYDGLKPVLDCPTQQKVRIGHQKYSQTSIPNKILIDNLAFYDCPGFRDNKGEEYEISNSFFVQRLLDIYQKVKIVLMIDESHISQARADKLPRLTKNLLKSFETFDDIQEGVTMIINRAERDLYVLDYHRQILKMCELRNEVGPLFGEQEQNFLKFLVNQNRILLFRQPRKQDRGLYFIPSENENSILRTIKFSNFVKSKHILNILSESAKLAIRDYIDFLTEQSNNKVEIICSQIVSKYSLKVSRKGKDIAGLLDLKEEVIDFAEEIKSSKKQKIASILQRQVPRQLAQDFSEDFSAIMFFKGIYDKTATYFSNLVNKIYTELTHLLTKMDNRILKVQKDEQQEIERKKTLQKQKQLEEKKKMNKLHNVEKIRKLENLKQQMEKLSQSNEEIVNSINESLNFLDEIQKSFKQIEDDTENLQSINKKFHHNMCSLENKYMRKIDF